MLPVPCEEGQRLLVLELLLVWLAFVFASGTIVIYLCHRWERDPGAWTVFAMATGPIAIVGLVGMRRLDVNRRVGRVEQVATTSRNQRVP